MRNQRSSAALVSVLVVGLVTLILVVAFSEASLSTLERHDHAQESSRSYYLAESCLEEAIARLESDLSFSSASIEFDAQRTCSINVSGSNPKTIDISTTVDDLEERYEATAEYSTSGTIYNFSLSSWGETL